MNEDVLKKISDLVEKNKINEAHLEISKLGPEYHKNSEYLYLRSKIFYSNKLYYLAIDTLLIALEFEKKDNAIFLKIILSSSSIFNIILVICIKLVKVLQKITKKQLNGIQNQQNKEKQMVNIILEI